MRRAPVARAALVLTGLAETTDLPAIARTDGTVIRRAATRARDCGPNAWVPCCNGRWVSWIRWRIPQAWRAPPKVQLGRLLLPLLRDVLIDVGIPASYGDYTPSRVSPATADQLTAAQRLLVAALWMPDGIENGEVVKSLRRVVLGMVPNTTGASRGC